MTIAQDTVVSIHYRVTNASGEEIDTSRGQAPLVYLHGHGEIVPGLERALHGREAGDNVQVTLAPVDAYGEFDPELEVGVPRAAFPADAQDRIEPGAAFVATHPDHPGDEIVFRVVGVEGDVVHVSGNHPLAGEALTFSVDVLDVRAATPGELAHGHAHSGEDEPDADGGEG